MIKWFLEDKVHEMYRSTDTEVELVFEALEQLRNIVSFENNGTTSRLLNFMRFCAGATPSAEQSVPLSPSEQETDDLMIPITPQLEPSSSYVLAPSVLPSVESTVMDSTFGQASDVVNDLSPSLTILTSLTNDSYPGASFMTHNVHDVAALDATPVNGGESQELDPEQHPWLNVTSLLQCDNAYRKLKNHINDVILEPYGNIQRDQDFFLIAEDFAQLSTNPELVKQVVYRQCYDLIDQGRNSIDFLQTLLYLVGRVVRGNIQEGLVAMEELVARLGQFQPPTSGVSYDDGLRRACAWWYDFPSRVKQQAEIYRIFITGVANMLFYINTPIQRWDNILSHVEVRSSLISDMMAQYLAKSITKQELAEQFFGEENVTKREGLFQGIKDIENLMQQYEEGVFMVSDFLWQGYFNLRHGRPVIINDTSAQSLVLVQKAWTVRSMIEWARNGNLDGIIKSIPEEIIKGPIKEINHNVTEPLLAMERQLKIVEATLREYQDSIKIDSQFYL